MDYFEKNRYPIIGGIVGVLIAVCIFTIGFWKMILVLFLIGLGIYIGLFLKGKYYGTRKHESIWNNGRKRNS